MHLVAFLGQNRPCSGIAVWIAQLMDVHCLCDMLQHLMWWRPGLTIPSSIVRTHWIGANPENQIVNFRVRTKKTLVNSVFCNVPRKNEQNAPKIRFGNQSWGTPRGPLSWTGPIANASEIYNSISEIVCVCAQRRSTASGITM